MGRRLRTDVPEIKQRLTPNWPRLQGFSEMDKKMKQKPKEMYEWQNRVRSVPTLSDDYFEVHDPLVIIYYVN